MLTSLYLATELFLLQKGSGDAVISELKQDAVLVIRERVEAGESERLSVSTPFSAAGMPPVGLAELRAMVQRSAEVADRPALSFIVDETIGGEPKIFKGDGDEGGIAGLDLAFDIQFSVTTDSAIPSAQLAEFTQALADVETYLESQIASENVTLVFEIGYVPLNPGRLGVTTCHYSVEQYETIGQAIVSAADLDDVQCMPVATTAPVRYSGVSIAVTPENRVFLLRSLKKALGIADGGGLGVPTTEGRITMNSAIQWDFDPSDGLTIGTTLLYSFQDHLIRELLQGLGFVAGADFLVRDCTMMDLIRFQRDVTDEQWLINSNTDVFGPPHPPAAVTCAQFSAIVIGFINGGQQFPGWALDYNPGLNRAAIDEYAAVLLAAGQGADIAAARVLASTEMLTDAGGPTPTRYMTDQMCGKLNLFTGLPESASQGNVFDDARLPVAAIPANQKTAYPDGATQSLKSVTVGAIAATTRCIAVDFREKSYTLTTGVTVVEFRGAMPRTVARNTQSDASIINFLQDTARLPSDFELEMFDGSPVRACFILQNELAPVGTRCIMGESIGKGVTFYSRNALNSYVAPLGLQPDFVTRRELLLLDTLGWKMTAAVLDATDEGDTTH
ncbi:MAG: hypothetical protein EXS17_00175 [Phycisphaerales bacterium]|nr:hypothetical protein [Phycisphaerales bacterium]